MATHSRMRIPSTTPRFYARTLRPGDLHPTERSAPLAPTYRRLRGHWSGQDRDGALPSGSREWSGPQPDPVDRPPGFVDLEPRKLPARRRYSVAALCKSSRRPSEAVALADSVEDVFFPAGSRGELRRLDPDSARQHRVVTAPSLVRELAELRRIRRSDPHWAGSWPSRRQRESSLAGAGNHLSDPRACPLHIDCSGGGVMTHAPVEGRLRGAIDQRSNGCGTLPTGLQRRPDRLHRIPRFTGRVVKNQSARRSWPPTVPLDWRRMYRVELGQRGSALGAEYPEVGDWMAASKARTIFNPHRGRSRLGVDGRSTEHSSAILRCVEQAADKIRTTPRRPAQLPADSSKAVSGGIQFSPPI